MSDAHQINEQTLIDSLESNSVKKIQLIQGSDGKFTICACLTWKGGGQILVTQRKRPRTWASLDRLVKHMKSKYTNIPTIELHMYKEPEPDENQQNSD